MSFDPKVYVWVGVAVYDRSSGSAEFDLDRLPPEVLAAI